jgi:hypothetical protein
VYAAAQWVISQTLNPGFISNTIASTTWQSLITIDGVLLGLFGIVFGAITAKQIRDTRSQILLIYDMILLIVANVVYLWSILDAFGSLSYIGSQSGAYFSSVGIIVPLSLTVTATFIMLLAASVPLIASIVDTNVTRP